MITRKEFLQNHWTYYLMLERKFLATIPFVSISLDNFSTYSDEYASLIQLIGAELDNFFKLYCGYNLNEVKNISHYASYILSDYPEIKGQDIELVDVDIVIRPFENWDCERAKQSLSWWEVFDNIKHNRIGNKKDASLKNTLDILGALYLLEIKYLRKISTEHNEPDIPNKESELFSLKDWEYQYIRSKDTFPAFMEFIKEMLDQKLNG